jgi:mono/diheme cytochrome c family protein
VRKIITGVLTIAFIGVLAAGAWKACAADDASPTPPADAPPLGTATPPAPDGKQTDDKGSGGAAQPGGPMLGPATPPRDLVTSTPKGQLKNPYTDIAAIADEGHHRYLSAGCNGCHGGGGGGGMCPALTNDTWVYGKDDDTLFRLVTLGSDELQKQGYTRVRTETVVGPMPPFGDILKTSDDLWRIIAFIRSVNPSSLNPPPPPPPQ